MTAAVALSILCTAITFHLTYRIINDEGATNAAVVGYLLPVVSVLLGTVVLGEDLGMRVVLGMAVVLWGVGMTRRPAAANVGKPTRGEAVSGELAAGEPGHAGGAAVSGVPAGAAPATVATIPPEEAR